MEINELFSPQNIITIIAILGSTLSVFHNWRKIGEDRKKRDSEESLRGQNDALWKLRIETKLEQLELKIDSFAATEKLNSDSIRANHEMLLIHSNTIQNVDRFENRLSACWTRLDEMRGELNEMHRINKEAKA